MALNSKILALCRTRGTKQIIVWNLICLERRLVDEKRSMDAFNIRLALDILSSNWRIVEDYKELILSV